MKINITGTQARDKAVAGMSYVAGVIKSTIGPFGLNMLIEKGNKITNDGYTISSELCPTLPDEFERRGAIVAHEASAKTNDMVGDATSTAWALTDSIVREAIRYLPNDKTIKAKKTPSEIAAMIKTAKEDVLTRLEAMATPITDCDTLIKSALVSVEDEEIAALLGKTQWEIGPDGFIIAEEVNEAESSIERVRGIRIDNGFGTSQVITNPERQSLEVSDIPILMTNYTIGTEELALLKNSVFSHLIAQKKWGVIFIARAFTADAIKTCMESMQSGFAIFPVNAPYVNQREIMHDIETVVGGRYVDTEESRLEDLYISDVGFAKRFIATQFSATVTGVEDEQAQARVDKRVTELKKKLEGEPSDFYKKMLESRIAQLTNGFAILKVGSQSLTNRKRLKDKCDDAVNAVRLALKGGTVEGAGKALKTISDQLDDTNILKRPLTCIYDQITSSAPEGWEVPEWVRDPYLVLKCALENACDFATTFSSINGIITTKDKKSCKCDNE